MRAWRRALLATISAMVILGVLTPSSWGQGTPPPDGPTGTTDPVDPGAQPSEDGVVHSWALAPAGSTDPSQPGNRATLTYEVAPGATLDDAVTLFNYSNVQLNFRLYATDAFNNEDGAFGLLPGEQAPTDVGSWITPAQENITLPARSQATVPVTVKVPADASAGDHVGAVLASSVALGTGADGKVVNLDRRTGARVYLRVEGPLTPELVVEGVTTTYKPSLNPLNGTADVTYRIRNRGNVRMQGTHNVSVGGLLGLAEKDTPSEDLPELLPGEDYTVRVTLNGVAATGLATTKVRLEPATIDGEDLPSNGRSTLTLAPPLTLIIGGLAVWLARRAQRAYSRHQDPGVVEAKAT